VKILLTNDDGISSPGIQKLVEKLRFRDHKVYVIAPETNRSGVSHALSLLRGPARLSPFGEDSFKCSGNPADCVLIGLMGALPEKPDIVVSGINQGANLGTDLVYSGTAAAARQASLLGIPSIALSLVSWENHYWDMAAAWSADNLEELLTWWKKDCFVNVNIPNLPEGPKGMLSAHPVVKRYDDHLTTVDDQRGSRWCFLILKDEIANMEEGSDHEAVTKGFASVSCIYNYNVVRN